MKIINILNLYPKHMNVYGDQGNIKVLVKRLTDYGFTPRITNYDIGDEFPDIKTIDIIVGGGGQDANQIIVAEDLQKISDNLHILIEENTPTLLVCGLYQLFGKRFDTFSGDLIPGIGILDLVTTGGYERLVGNTSVESPEFGLIIGFENHSGITKLGKGIEPLGRVKKGAGNNNVDGTEGARYKNLIGTYTHGPILPKNPNIADWLIEQAVKNKYPDSLPLKKLPDIYVKPARQIALKRPR